MIHDEDSRGLDFETRLKRLLEAPIGVDKFFQYGLGLCEVENTDEDEEVFIPLTEVL